MKFARSFGFLLFVVVAVNRRAGTGDVENDFTCSTMTSFSKIIINRAPEIKVHGKKLEDHT